MSEGILRPDSNPTVVPTQPTLDEQLAIRLHNHTQRLQLILPVITTAVMALRYQKAELDEDIASVLIRNACDPLEVEITQLEALLAHRDEPRRPCRLRPVEHERSEP